MQLCIKCVVWGRIGAPCSPVKHMVFEPQSKSEHTQEALRSGHTTSTEKLLTSAS